jgi:hypothetical protein
MGKLVAWVCVAIGCVLLADFLSVNIATAPAPGAQGEEWRLGAPASPWLVWLRDGRGERPPGSRHAPSVTVNVVSWSGLVGLAGGLLLGIGWRLAGPGPSPRSRGRRPDRSTEGSAPAGALPGAKSG